MSIEITAPSAAEEQRRGLMAALEVAAHIISIAPIPLTHVATNCTPFAVDAPYVDVNFYGPTGAEGVEQLAKALGAAATTRPHSVDNPAPYTSFNAVVNEVPVRVWTLGEAPQDSEAGER